MSWTKTRSEIALHKRNHPFDPIPVELYQELKAGRLAEHIQKVISAAPHLTAEQRDRLAILLRPDPRDLGGDAA